MPIMAETMYVLDAHSLIYQVYYALPAMTGPEGQPTNALYGFTGDLLRVWQRQPTYLVCVFDAPGKTFREDMYAAYKAHRPPMPDDLAAQLPHISRVLEAMRIARLEVPGYEADDVMATLARLGSERQVEVFLCTSDKDCRQLIGPHVRLLNLRKDQVLDAQGLEKEWGIRPEQVVDFLALVGDSVDNVPGVPGIGPKTASKLLARFGTLDRLLERLEEVEPPRIREALRAHRQDLAISRQLVKLEQLVPIVPAWSRWRRQVPDFQALAELFREFGFKRYQDELQRIARAAGAQRQGALFPPHDGSSGQTSADDAAEAWHPDPDWTADYRVIRHWTELDQVVARIAEAGRFALDAETTGLDPHRCDLVGLALCCQEGLAWYVPVRAPQGQPFLPADQVLARLRPLLESDQVGKVNQNIKYDATVLRHLGIRLRGIVGDPMIAGHLLSYGQRHNTLEDLSRQYLHHEAMPIAHLIGSERQPRSMDAVDVERVAWYAGEDADIAWRLCQVLEPLLPEHGLDTLYRQVELPLVEVLVDMEYNGVKLDIARLERLGEEFARMLAALEQEIYALAGRAFNIASPKQLRQVLFDELKLPQRRRTALTGEVSTRQDVLAELAARGYDLPRKVLTYRQIAKLKGTYVDALPALVHPRTGRVHATFQQTATATGRLSSRNPNLQNIPVRSEEGRQIRQAFVAELPGWLLVSADYSQIELRILAHLAEDAELMRAFAADRDIHAYVAAQVYGVDEAAVTPEQRRQAKAINFGVVYGLSAFGLAQRLGIGQEQAAAFIDAWFARYPGVAKFQQKVLDEARQNGYVSTVLGRRRRVQGIRPQSSYRQRNPAEREALNTVIQGSAADLIKLAMVHIHRRLQQEGLQARMILQIHDELVFETPRSELPALAQVVEEEMTRALPLRVPLKVDVAAGPNWLDVEPLDRVMERA
ncbi:MAG: DNA polymerase I [Gemmataceae bacterium]